MGNEHSNGSAKRTKFRDHYTSGDRIGSGTFATVKKCRRNKDGRQFAVKIIDKRHLTGRELVGLKDEIRILRSLHHPHMIPMMDVFDDGRRVKMVLELCGGGDLFDEICRQKARKFDERLSAEVTVTLARSIGYLHSHFVVHRDLKPENILLTKPFSEGGILKVTDFGLAHLCKLEPKLHIMHTCCGTPHYVAPEVLSSNQYSTEVDFWSIGVILYIMLSGFQPFNSHSIHEMYGMIIRGQYKFPSPQWDGISAEAIDLVKRLMTCDPKKRYTAEQVQQHAWIRKHVDFKEMERKEQHHLTQQYAMKGMTPAQAKAHSKSLISEQEQDDEKRKESKTT